MEELAATCRVRGLRGAAIALGLAFFVSGCGGTGENLADSPDTQTTVVAAEEAGDSVAMTEPSVVEPSSDASVPTTASEDGASQSATTTAPELGPIVNVLPVLETNATEAGPRPLLSWQVVSDAASYELTVLNADGNPYWSWSGPEPGVFLGGMENPDAIGAWVFEELTWVVTARDADGATLALSDRATLNP
ncbi:MAG: hypothetical protein V3V01_19420 [Acidimicrobiales bacterium]